MKQYDVVVIGTGSAGLTVTYTARGFGKKVLVIDKNKPGGECTWHGCVPSKAFINEAEKVYNVRKYVPEYHYDSSDVFKHIDAVRLGIYEHESPEKLLKDGIDYLKGAACFVDGNTVMVGEEKIQGKKIYICTGSRPFIPKIDGLETVPYLTNETFFEQKKLPDSLIILGGGPIGVELAQAANRLGVHVEVVEMMPRIMVREESVLVEALTKQLQSEGVVIHTNTKAITVRESNGKIHVVGDKNGESIQIEGESLLVAIGRKANVEGLELEKAGIDYNEKGIVVDTSMRTTNKNVYGVGDVAGPYFFSHMANVQGIAAAMDGVLPIRRTVNYKNVGWVTFTKPELARAGLTEKEAREKHKDIRVYAYDFNELDRARTKGDTNEQMKLILDRKGKVLGASILADRAGEMIGEIQLLRTLNKNFAKMSNVIHPYPTYSEVFTKLGKKVTIDNLWHLPIVRWFRK